MENEVSAAPVEETAVAQPFYGLTNDHRIIELGEHEYASAALNQLKHDDEEAGRDTEVLPMVFNDLQYRSILSAVAAELTDADGDGQVPTYLVVPYSTQQAVFPHPSVNTDEEAAEFVAEYPLEIVGPIKLATVRDSWPHFE